MNLDQIESLSPQLSEIEDEETHISTQVLSDIEEDQINASTPILSDAENETSNPPVPNLQDNSAHRFSFEALSKEFESENEFHPFSLQGSSNNSPELSDFEEEDEKALAEMGKVLEHALSPFQMDAIATDDSELSEDDLEERIKRLPLPKKPNPNDIYAAKSELDASQRELDLMRALLRANGQTVEQLDFMGPSRNVNSVPEEVFRKVDQTEKVRIAVAKESTWKDLYNRQIKVEDDLFSNHLKGRFDFGGSRATAYIQKVRKIGMDF